MKKRRRIWYKSKNLKKHIFFITLCISTIPLLFDLWWLSVLVLIFTVSYFLIKYSLSRIQSTLAKNILKAFFSGLFIISFSVAVRLFLLGVFYVPTPSMKPTLNPGDVIFVNKLSYGPIMPRSINEIPWINIGAFFLMDDTTSPTLWKYRRLSGLNKIKNNDIVVFQKKGSGSFIVKRCVGIAGNEIMVLRGKIYIDKENILLRTKLKETSTNNQDENNSFVGRQSSKWDINNFGPILIPKKGMKIRLTDKVLQLYGDIIRDYEYHEIKKRGTHYYIDNRKTIFYTFNQDYYFMMGDNRNMSFDSRFYGFIPQEKIIGKVIQ